MKKQIEVFTAGSPVCEPVVRLVKETACDNCEITIYNIVEQCDCDCVSKINDYGIKRLPAIAVDGKLLDCCKNIEITKDDLIKEGIGVC